MKNMTNRRRTRRIIAGLSLFALLGSLVQSPVAVAQASEPDTSDISRYAAPKPPPPPVGADGKQLQGGWFGPYSFRNVHSGKCLDMSGTGDGAGAVQYQCLAGWASQKWYLWQTQGDGSVAYLLLGNGMTGKCLEPIPWSRGGRVMQYPCMTLANQEWIRTVGNMNLYTNAATNFCMEVGGWSKNDGAAVIQWDCFGNNNQLWMQYDWR